MQALGQGALSCTERAFVSTFFTLMKDTLARTIFVCVSPCLDMSCLNNFLVMAKREKYIFVAIPLCRSLSCPLFLIASVPKNKACACKHSRHWEFIFSSKSNSISTHSSKAIVYDCIQNRCNGFFLFHFLHSCYKEMLTWTQKFLFNLLSFFQNL